MTDLIMKVGFEEDASVKDVMEHLTTVRDTMNDIDDKGSKQSVASSFLDQFGLSDLGRSEVVSTLSNSIKALGGLGTSLDSIPTHLHRSFSVLKTEVEGLEKLLNGFNKNQGSIIGNKIQGIDSIQQLMMYTASLKAQTDNIKTFHDEFKSLKSSDIGWSKDIFMKHAPGATAYIDSFIRQILPENKNGVRIESLINQATTNKAIRSYMSHLMESEGVDIKSQNAKDWISKNIEMMIRSGSGYLLQTSIGQTLDFMRKKKVFETIDAPTNVEQRFKNDPLGYQKNIYAGFGHDAYTEAQAAAAIAGRSKGSLSWRFSKNQARNSLSQLYDYLQSGDNMDMLYPLLRQTGIATIGNDGKYRIREHVREEQLQMLRALTLQEYNRALRSDAIYEASPTSVALSGKIVNRQGKAPQLYLGLNEALPESIIPSLNTYQKGKTDGFGHWVDTQIDVGKTATLDRYYIPQTSIDFSTRQAKVRDNFWHKDLSKGIQENPDDEFVAITDSLMARLFGMEGNRTLGFGNDKTGAIKRVDENGKQLAPKLFVSDFSRFLTYDDKEGKYVVDTQNPDYKMAEDILSRKATVKYGNDEYRFLYSKDDGRAIFGKDSIVQAINKRFEDAHLPSIFDFGNDREGGLFFGGGNNFQKSIKQVSALAKEASSGTAIEDLMSDEQARRLKNSKGIYANFEMLYEILDEAEKSNTDAPYTGKWAKIMGRRMDGLAFGDPTIFNKDFQGRYAGGTEKFAMGAYDWRPMLLAGWNSGNKINSRIYGYDSGYEDSMSDAEKEKHRAVYVPTGGATGSEDKKRVQEYITGRYVEDRTDINGRMHKAGETISDDELLNLRDQYFTNAVASDAAFIIDRTANKSGLAFRTMQLKHFWDETASPDANGKKGLFSKEALERAIGEGRVDNEGNVRLNAAEQEEYKRIYAQTAMGNSGFIEMKNEGDMLSEKNFIPESVLRATNAPAEVFARSERLYNQRLQALQTTAGRIAEFRNDPNAMQAIRQNPNWVWENQTAITHIEQTRRSLEANRARNMIMLNGEDERREGAVAVGTVGQLAEVLNGLTGLSDEEYGQFQALLPKYLEDNNAVFSSGISAKVIDMLGRFPWASGQYMMDVKNYGQAEVVKEYFDTKDEIDNLENKISKLRQKKNPTTQDTEELRKSEDNLSKLQNVIKLYDNELEQGPDRLPALRVAKALNASGRDPRRINSMIMTASQIYSMNTGDFDGDTVNAFIGLSKEFKENARAELEAVSPKIKENRLRKLREAGVEEPDQVELSSLGEAVMQSWALSSTATEKMAVASAALRKAQTSDNGVDRIAALAEAMEAYDLATSDVKTKGAKFTMGSHAEQYLYSQGAHYERFIKQLQDSADKTGLNEEDVYQKGAIFKFSGYGTNDPEGIFAMSARHSNTAYRSTEKERQRYIDSLNAKGITGDDFDKQLKDWDAKNQAEYVQGIFDLDSYQKLENWYKKAYGIDNSPDAQAARFMLDRMEDTLIWGQLWDDDEMKKGREILAKWRSKIDVQATSGIIPEDQIRQANDFEHRLGEMEKNGTTVSNIRRSAEEYRALASIEADPKVKRGYELYAQGLERMLPENQNESERKERQAFIDSQKKLTYTANDNARRIIADSTDQKEIDSYVQNMRMQAVMDAAAGHSPVGSTIYNWSNLKHFIGAKTVDHALTFGARDIDLNSVIDPNSGKLKRDAQGNIQAETSTGTADYYENNSKFAEALRDIVYTQSGEMDKTSAYNNATTHIGQLMHFAFEHMLDPTEIASRSGRRDLNNSFWLDWLRNAFSGTNDSYDTAGFDAAALKSLGYKITERNGQFVVEQGPGKSRHSQNNLTDIQNRINNLFGTIDSNGRRSKGFLERQAEYIAALETENGEEVLSIEDKLFRNGQRVNLDTGKGRFGGNFYRRIVTDKDGKIVSSETALDPGDFNYTVDEKKGEVAHTFETHAKPDRAALMAADAEGHRRIHIYDWKSSLPGANDSVPQSVYYGQLFGELAKRYHDSVAAGTPDDRYEQFKEWGWYDKSGKFVNALGLVTGVDAQSMKNRDVDFTTTEGVNKAKEWMSKIDRAMLLEEQLGLEGFKDSWALLESAQEYKNKMDTQTKSAMELVNDKDWKPDDRQTQFFLSTYAQNKERLKELESDIYKENNRNTAYDYIPTDRFSRREKELTEMFTQEALAAQITMGPDEVKDEIEDIQKRRTRALTLNNASARAAASQDLIDARTQIRQSLTGIMPTEEANAALQAMYKARNAAHTMDYLTANERYYNVNPNKGKIGFRTRKNGETDSSIYEEAEAREEAYAKALAERETTEKFLNNELDSYYSRYDKSQSSKIESLTRLKPLDPTEALNKYIENTKNKLQKEIDQYNENIRRYDEEINKKGASPERIAQLERFKARDQKSAEELSAFLSGGGIEQNVLREQAEKLGMVYKSPQQRAQEWLNQRTAVLQAQGLVDQDWLDKEKNEAFIRSQQGTESQMATAAAEYVRLSGLKGDQGRGKIYQAQANQMQKFLEQSEQQQIDDLLRSASSPISTEEQVRRQVNARREAAFNRLIQMSPDDPNFMRLYSNVMDNNFWQKESETEIARRNGFQDMQFQVQQQRLEENAANALANQQYQAEQFERQRNQALTFTSYGRNSNVYKNRVSQLQHNVDQWQRQVMDMGPGFQSALVMENNYNQQQLKEYEQNWKGSKEELQKDKEYQRRYIAAQKTQQQIDNYNGMISNATNEIDRLSGAGGMLRSAFDTAGQAVGRLAQRFGRRIFMKAYQEAVQFVKQFDASMTSIQMITLKTDEQMSTLGDGLIDKAKELKVSISDITKSAETLYRQGLSDDEVNDRLEVISKFSKVSGTKVDDATKLITIAMNTGLVTDASYAADVVTALGDNAATNAAQIEKGIEKAGAAAAADGTTFEELTAMLTAITSTTQIGGNVAGRTLNTIFGRMNKIGTNELITDENGNMISGSAVATLLKAQGVDTYDQNGNKRSSYDVLYDLAQKWEGMSDAEQQQIANAIAGTRQYSNFSAIMQGMTEGKVDEYMELAGNSSGVMDKKYEIYLKSLQASLNDLKNAFDELVHDFVQKGYAQDFVQNITTMINGVDKLVEAFGGLEGVMPTLLLFLGALSGLKYGPVGAAIGAVAGLGTYGILSALGNTSEQTVEERLSEAASFSQDRYNKRIEDINRLTSLANKKDRSDSEEREYKALVDTLSSYAGLSSSVADAADGAESFADAADRVASSTENASRYSKEYADNVAKEAKQRVEQVKLQDIYASMSDSAEKIAKSGNSGVDDYLDTSEGAYEKLKAKSDAFASKLNIGGYEFGNDGLAKTVEAAVKLYNNSPNPAAQKIGSDYLDVVAEYFADMSKNNPDMKGKDKAYWKDQMLNSNSVSVAGLLRITPPLGWFTPGGYGTIQSDVVDNVLDFGLDFSKYGEGSLAAQRKGLEEGFASIFEMHGIEDKYISALVKNAVDGYYADERTKPVDGKRPAIVQDVILDQLRRIYGFTGDVNSLNQEDFQQNVKLSAKEGGYVPREYNGVELSEGDYFIDENGDAISYDEMKKRVDKYNLENQQNQLATMKFNYFDKNGNLLSSADASEYKTLDEARKSAGIKKYYTFTDEKGNTHYYETSEQRDAEQKAYETENAQYTTAVSIGNRRTTFTGTNAELQDYLAEENSKAYKVVDENGNIIGAYANEEDANTQRAIASMIKNAHYLGESAKKEALEIFGTTYQYEDIDKTIQEATGPFGLASLERRRSQEIKDNPWILAYEDTGNYYASYPTRDAAYSDFLKNRYYYNPQTGKAWGYGDEGRNAYDEALAAYEHPGNRMYFVNGKPVGVGGEGQEAAYQDWYTFTGLNGKQEWYQTEKEASDEWRKQNEIIEKAKRTYANYEDYVIGNESMPFWKYYLSSAKGAKFDESGNLVFSDEISERVPYEAISWETDESITGEKPELAWLDDLEIRKGENYIGKIESQKPNLEDIVKPGDLTVLSEIATSYGQNIVKPLTQAGEETIEAIEEAGETIEKVEIPKYTIAYDNFLGGAVNSYSVWQTDSKNKYAVAADKMLREMSGYDNLQSLMRHIDVDNVQEWSALYQNADFGRLMSQIQTDGHGNILSAPEDMLQQISDFLSANGRDYGARTVTMNEKATKALSAFNGLTNDNWYVSLEARNQALEEEYQKNVVEPYEHTLSFADERGKQYIQTLNPMMSRDEYAISKFGDLHYLNETSDSYLKEILGEELAHKVKDENTELSSLESVYATTLLNNAIGGYQGLTAQQKLEGIETIRGMSAEQFRENWKNSASTMSAYLNGWSGAGEYAMLMSSDDLNDKQKTRLQELEKEFEEFQKNAQVDVEIAGLQTLENANELLQGTVANIKALKQGGTVALEVVTKMRTEAYESGQQTAKLYSGKRSEQDEAAMAILGMSEDQFRLDREGNIQRAKQYKQDMSGVTVASYNAERKALLDKVNEARNSGDLKARAAAASQLRDLDSIYASEGYFWNSETESYEYDPSRLKVNYINQKTWLETEQTRQQENNLSPIYSKIANGDDLTDYAYELGLLRENDEMYKGMLLAGAPEADVRAYAQRMAQGQKGTFAQNYGWAMQNAFGDNWQNGEFDLASAQRWYKEVMTGDNREFYENMFGQMENGEQWMKLLSGEITGDTTQLEEDLAKGLVRDRFEAEFAGYRNKDQMVENAVNLAGGTYAEQQQAASSYYSQLANVSKAQYALGSGLNNESNRSAIASLLEIDDQQVKTLMSTEAGRDSLYKMIQEKSQNVYAEMIKVFTEAFDLDKIEGLNLDGVTDLESLINELYAAWETADGEQKEHLEQMIAMAEEAANAADASNSADFVAARDRILEKTSENANNAQATAWFSNYLENSFGKDQEYYGESNGNIELNHRPKYWNTDDEGNVTGYSTEDSITIWDEDKKAYAVIPTIVNGNRYNHGQAIQHYYESDEHLGTFESLADAEGYSQNLHLRGSYFHDDNLTERERQIESMFASATLAGYDADALFNEHPELVYASEMYKNNEMDFGGLKTIFDTAALGSEKDYGYYSSLQQALFGDFVDSNGHFNINETNQDAFLERYTNLQQSETGGKELLQEYESYIPNLNKAMKSLKNGSEDAAEGINDVNKEVDNNKAKQLQRYGDYADDAAQSFKNLTNGGKTTVKELAAIKKRMEDLQDVNTAVGKASGKSGKQLDKHTREILANYLGIDADTLKDYSKEELADALTGVQDAVNEEFNETTFEPLIQAGLADINAALDEGVIDYDIKVKPIFNADDTINMDEFVALLNEIHSQYASTAESMAGHVLTYMIRALQTTNDDGSTRIDVDSTVTSSTLKTGGGAHNGYNSKGSSSGGSGKSDTDKTIEKVENRETKAKHKVTMAQLVQEHYGFTNEYQNQINAIYDEVSAQKGLLDVYKDNLSLLEAQQDAVTTYSDDWWKLEKQILSTQESIQETKNTIESLDSKVIEVVTAKQENEDRPYTHTRNMINSYVDRYSTIYESGSTMSEAAAYNKWVTNKNLQTDSIRQQINQNKEQISEWQDLLSKIDENNDNYETVKDNIWALQEENAELENELLSQEIELNEARLSRIAQVLQNTNSTYEHEINMSDTQGQIYQINRDYSGYRQELANQRANYKNQVKPYQDAITSIREQMATLTPYSAAWYSARDSLYEYEEALEQLSLSIEETDQALRESYLNELFENIDKVNTAAGYRMTGLQERTRNSKLAGDNKNYVKNLDKERLEIVKEITEQQNALDDLINLKNSGKIKKGTAEWDELLNKIKEVQNNMAKLENDAAEKYQETAAASLQGIVDKYDERTRDTNHAMDILKTQESEYRSSGEYTNLKTNLNAQYDLEKQRSKELKAERKELVKELSRYGEGSFEYNNVLKQIQSVDKELATSNNTLKSLKKSADEVDKQMLKATASYENYVHNMYKSIVQQQKDQLNATVSMQNTVLEAIKKSYQEQWNLIKKDIDKKKQALQEEKNIIQERLNARKQAEQQTDKEEQLAELQKQLMIIEADPTRTKEAKELRKQIDDLQKELSGNLADNLASAETKRIDDAIKGMSQYQSNTEEDMNDYLKDANNFKTVFDNLFSGSEEAFYEFMEEINASDMKNKTAEQIEQLKNSWHDQWLKMNGEVETYWEEVASSIKITEDNRKQVRKQLLKLLKQTNAYKSAGEAGRQQQIAEIDDYIESAINAKKVSAEAGDPTIAILGDTNAKIEELKSNTYKTLLDESAQAKLSAIANAVTGSKKYIGGGLVNYTGIARVDGTPSRPEAFLDAEDTANIRAMLDQFSYVKTMPFMSHIDGGMFGGTSNSIGDVNITINQAELSSDQDIEALAGKVGQAFTRELSKRGFNTASYAF